VESGRVVGPVQVLGDSYAYPPADIYNIDPSAQPSAMFNPKPADITIDANGRPMLSMTPSSYVSPETLASHQERGQVGAVPGSVAPATPTPLPVAAIPAAPPNPVAMPSAPPVAQQPTSLGQALAMAPSYWGMSALSPEQQAQIVHSAIGTMGVLQQGQEHGVLSNVRERTLRLREDLQGLEKQKLEAQIKGDGVTARYHQAHIDKINSELQAIRGLPPGEQAAATLAPHVWAKSNLDKLGLGVGTKEGMRVAYARYIATTMFAGDPDAESKALAFVNKSDKSSFIKEMLPKVNLGGTSEPEQINAMIDNLGLAYDRMHGINVPATKDYDASKERFNKIYTP
jgi:hypothetical protein